MASALQLLQKVEQMDLTGAAADALDAKKARIAELQRKQMYEGVTSQDRKIGEYAESTRKIKQRKGQPSDRVTLRDEGDFYKGIKIEVYREMIRTASTDYKHRWLVGKYGDEIYGLNYDSRVEVKPELQIAFIEAVKQQVGF